MNGAELRAHLHGELLPLWARHGLDPEHGGYASQLDAALRPLPGDRKRLLVQTRLLWAFSRGALATGDDALLAAARAAFDFLHTHFRDPEHGGWFLETTPAGRPLVPDKDTYAHAFVVFALAAYEPASGDLRARGLAADTLERIDARLGDAEHGGWFDGASRDWQPRRERRRQNPHMHLFEALLALYETTRDTRHLERARAILALLRERFAPDGVLFEHFARDWSPAPAPAGLAVEPGHHFEWTWLLHEFARLSGDDGARADAERLFAFAARHGVDPEHGGVVDEVGPDGRVRRATKRLWPQTECLRALAVRGDERTRAFLELVWKRYRDADTGGWHEQADASGALTSAAMNATSVYHVYGALDAVAEALG